MSRNNKLVYEEDLFSTTTVESESQSLDKQQKSTKRGTAKHVPRDKNLQKYKKGSHKTGDLVEFIGRDRKNRGLGIVLVETARNGTTHGFSGQEKFLWKDEDYTHLKIFWQNSNEEEVIHKEMVRKAIVADKGVVKKKPK